jgi:hypothetical protein
MAQYDLIRSNAVFAILIAMFAGIMIFIYTVEPEVREEILPPYVIDYENTVFDVTPGELNSGTTIEGVKRIPLNDIIVDNTIKLTELDVARDATFSSSIFTSDVYEFGFSVDFEHVNSAGLTFVVYDISGDANIKVYLNGKTILSRAAVIGGQVTIDFPKTYLENGANYVEITTDSPTLQFWQKNSVTVLDLEIFTYEYNTRDAQVNQIFSLSSSEVANAREVTLESYIISEGEQANLDIKLNGNRLIKAIPTQNLEFSIPVTALKEGANIIDWNVDKDGKYNVRFANILIDTVKTSGRSTTYFFSINDDAYKKAQRTSDYECVLSLVKDTGDDSINVEVNSRIEKFYFTSGEVKIDICDDLLDGRNEIKFSAEDELDLKQAALIIQNIE